MDILHPFMFCLQNNQHVWLKTYVWYLLILLGFLIGTMKNKRHAFIFAQYEIFHYLPTL